METFPTFLRIWHVPPSPTLHFRLHINPLPPEDSGADGANKLGDELVQAMAMAQALAHAQGKRFGVRAHIDYLRRAFQSITYRLALIAAAEVE
jgi:hypothetical protein